MPQPLRLRQDPLAAGDEPAFDRRQEHREDQPPRQKDEAAVIAASGREALALSPSRCLVVLGPPGCGKTTLLQDLLSQAVLQAQQDPAAPLPLFLFLPDLARTGLSLDAYLSLVARGMGLDSRFGRSLWYALRAGQALCCLDGLDEVAPAARPTVIALINDCASQYGGTWIVGSRYSEYKSGQFAHACFSEWELLPLDATSRRALVRHLLHALRDAQQGAGDDVGLNAAAGDLLTALQRSAHAAWAGNPLLLSLVTAVYAREQRLPGTRAALYRAIGDAVLSIRVPDPTRQTELRDVLAGVALRLFQSKGRTFSRAALQSHLTALGHDREHDGTLLERVIGSGLLDAVGAESYAFSHQTVQEYLAAVALASALLHPDGDTRIAAQDLIWSRRNFSRWTEVLALLAGVLVQDHGPSGAQAAHRWIQALADQHAAPAGDPGDLGLALALRSIAEVGESVAHPRQAALAGLATELATRWAHALIAECRRYDDEYAMQRAARYQRLRALAEAVARLPGVAVDAAATVLAPALSDREPAFVVEAAQNLATLASPTALAALEPILRSGRSYYSSVLRTVASHAPAEWVAALLFELLFAGSYLVAVGEALAQLGDAVPLEPLLAALNHASGGRRWRAVQALGYLGARVPMAAWLTAAQDPAKLIRVCGLEALGHWGDATAVPVLLAAVEGEDVEVRVCAAEALVARGYPPPEAPVMAVLQADNHADLRRRLARALGTLGPRAPLGSFLALLRAERDWERAIGVAGLQAASSHAPLEPLLAILADPRPEVRSAALQVLGTLGSRAPLQPLLDALRDVAVEVRRMALVALGAPAYGRYHARPTRRAEDGLLVFRSEADPAAVSMTISQSLDAGGRERLLDALLGVLDDPDAKVREHAVRVLATWRERAPLGAVLGALEDPVAEVRAAAIDALTPLIGRVAPARLLALLDDHDHHARMAARRLVGQAGAPLLADDVPAFFADRQRSGQVPACQAALQMLATLGAAAPIAPLAAALHSPQPAVSAAARDALVAAGRAAQPSLRAALADAQPHVRAYALQGLWQVAEDERPALLETALHDLPALAYHCSDHYVKRAHLLAGWLSHLAPLELLVVALSHAEADVRVGAGLALWERSKAEPIVELLPLLVRYGLVEETQHGGGPSLRLAAADTLVCCLLAALLGEQGIAVPLDAAWETFSCSNRNFKGIHDAAFVAQWQYLPVDHLLSVAANEAFVPWKRMMAVRALGRIMQAGRPDLREWLLGLLRDERAWLDEAVIDSLAPVASEIPAASLVAAVLKVDRGISDVAARVIGQMGDQAPIAEMIDALRTRQLTPRQRYAALRALKPLADRVPAQPLIRLFAQVEDGSQRAILKILGARAPHEIVRQAADSPFASVRKKALELMGDQAPFLAILPFVEDPHYENRDPDSPLLRVLGAVATPEQLIDVLEHSIYPEVRATAAGALAHHDQPAARAVLLRARSDEDAGVRAQALRALGPDVPLDLLLAAVADESECVRETAMGRLQASHADALAPVIEEAAAFLLGQGSGQVIGSLVQRGVALAIGEMARAPAGLVAHAGELLDWPHWDVQCEAARALGKLRRNVPDRAIRRLLALRRDAASPAVRRAADDALSEILSLETGIEDD